ncbi:MAG: MFS transporter [Spirochaetales bacterium]|nr:MFS transporter [Spirochaetales bacterium]
MKIKPVINEKDKLTIVQKLGYGSGDIFGGGAMIIVGFMYLFFLTDVVKLAPSLAGIVILISKMWDAVSDPLMGILSDRTKTRFGRRRPYFLLGIFFIVISMLLLWYPVNFKSELYRFAFVLFSYLFFSTVITMVMIPYNALASELTGDYNERTSLTAFRIFFSSASSLICAVLPMEIVKRSADIRQGYITMGLVFGIFFALPFITTFLFTKEKSEFQKLKPKLDLRETFIKPFTIPSFVRILTMFLFSFLAMDVMMSVMIYFMTYYLGRGNESDFVFGTLLVVQIVSLPFYSFLSKKTGKRNAFLAAGSAWVMILLGSLLIKPNNPHSFIYILAGLMGFASGGIVIMIYAIFPDMPDIDELYTGKRREGTYAGMFTFLRKLSSALALFLISQAIQIAGYMPPKTSVVNGVTKSINQVQNPSFILTIRLIFAVTPILLLIFSLYGDLKYKLTPTIHAQLKGYLERQRARVIAGNAMDDEPDEDKKLFYELKKIL